MAGVRPEDGPITRSDVTRWVQAFTEQANEIRRSGAASDMSDTCEWAPRSAVPA